MPWQHKSQRFQSRSVFLQALIYFVQAKYICRDPVTLKVEPCSFEVGHKWVSIAFQPKTIFAFRPELRHIFQACSGIKFTTQKYMWQRKGWLGYLFVSEHQGWGLLEGITVLISPFPSKSVIFPCLIERLFKAKCYIICQYRRTVFAWV